MSEFKQYVGASSEPLGGGPRQPTPSEEAVASLQGMSERVMEMAAQLEDRLGPILAQVLPTTGGGAVPKAPPSGSSEHVMSLRKVYETLNMTRERLTTLFERIEV